MAGGNDPLAGNDHRARRRAVLPPAQWRKQAKAEAYANPAWAASSVESGDNKRAHEPPIHNLPPMRNHVTTFTGNQDSPKATSYSHIRNGSAQPPQCSIETFGSNDHGEEKHMRTPICNQINRRQFIQRSAVATGAVMLERRFGSLHAAQSPGRATDWVQLGTKPALKIPRLGIGTGSVGGSIQRNLGLDGFTHLIRHAYDRGVRYIDTADNYKTHEMIRGAIKGIPRETLFIQTKMA